MIKRIVALIVCCVAISPPVMLFSDSAVDKYLEIDNYEKHAQQQSQAAREHLKQYQWRRDEAVLLLGNGTGNIANFIARELVNGSVTSLEPTEASVEYKTAHFTDERITFVQGNLLENSYEGAFNLLVAIDPSVSNEQIPQLLINAHQSLGDGGNLLMVFSNLLSKEMPGIFTELNAQEMWKGYPLSMEQQLPFDSEVFNELLSITGFTNISVEKKVVVTIFPARISLKNWFLYTQPYSKAIPEELQSQYANDFVKIYMQSFPSNGCGIIPYYQTVWLLKATK